MLLFKRHVQPAMALVRLTLFFGISLHSVLCIGQSVSAPQPHHNVYGHQPTSQTLRAELSCRFVYPQGNFEIHPHLGNNNSELNKLDAFIHEAINHPTLYISRIRLTGYSSIEGYYHSNEQLARDRANGFWQYLRHNYPSLYRYPYDIAWVAEDWKELSNLVHNSHLNEREEILEIIRKVSGFDDRERLLTKLNGGQPYAYIERIMLPQLRRVEIEVEYTHEPQSYSPQKKSVSQNNLPPAPVREKEEEKEEEEDSKVVTYQHQSLEAVNTVVPEPSVQRQEYPEDEELASITQKFALKTNLLLWAGVQPDFKYTAPVANAALEYYVNDNWSVEFGAMYSYWRYNSNREFQGISGYRLEPRYSFSVVSKGNWIKGYLGLYGRMGDYDSRTIDSSSADDNNAQPTLNYTGDYWDAGLSAGLTFHLIGGFGFEVGARTGYVSTNAIKYTKDGEYNWFEAREQYNKFRITDLNISLIYRFR